MRIIKDKVFIKNFINILLYISKDNIAAALEFEQELNTRINGLNSFPFKNRKSIYFKNENYRDLIYKGYTIIYKIEKDTIIILDIFKWQDR